MVRRLSDFRRYLAVATASLRRLATREVLTRRVATLWLSAAVVGTLAVSVLTWRLILDVVPLTLAAETRLTEIRQLSVDDFAARDSASLDELQSRVDRIQSEVSPAAGYMTWLARLSPSLAWLPALDHEIVAWAAQARRLQSDVESASTLLAASSQLLEDYRGAQAVLVNLRADAPTSLLSTQARELESTFAVTFADVTEAARTGRRSRPALRVPGVRDAMPLVDEVEERMLTASMIGQQASVLLAELLELGDRVRPLMEQFVVTEQESNPLTATELRPALAEVDRRVESASVKAGGLTRLVAETEASGQFRGRLDLLGNLLDVLLAVNRATLVALDVVEPTLRGAQASGEGLLGEDGTLLSVLKGVVEREGELNEALDRLDAARLTLTDLNSRGDQVEELRGLEDLVEAVDLLREGLQLVIDIAPVGAKLVGVDSVQRYLVLGQSADELRATGGFVSALWLVTFENGRVADIRYHDTVLVDATERLMLYPPAPPGLEEHMYANVWLLRDVSWEPDFPTTARTAADLYNLGQRQSVDGVVALNQWTLLSLLEGLGSVSSPGGGSPLTSRNLMSKLEQESDEHGRAYVDLTLQGILERLNEPMSLSTTMRLASALQESLREVSSKSV